MKFSGPTYGVAAEKYTGGKNVVLMVFVKVLSDDQGRGHVDEGGTHSVEQTVGEKQPSHRAYE